jgi:TolB-like protein
MLKFPFLFLLLITALPLVGQEPYSLAQFPFKIIGDVDPYLADFLEESILSELTSSTAITIKDIWNEEIDKEVEDLSGLTETAIVELGEKWNFDLFLTGYLAMERGELILFYQVYTTDKGICILAKRISVQPEDIIQEAKKLGRELVQELTWIRSVDLDTYMDSMLSLELFDEIYRFLYAREHLVSGEDLRQYSQRLALGREGHKVKRVLYCSG